MLEYHVLLVTEKEEDYDYFQSLLGNSKGSTFHLDWKTSFYEGLEALERRHYDVVLVDYDLGTHTGAEYVQACEQRGFHVPHILFTDDEGWLSHDDALACSAVRCMLRKEMTADSLKNAIMQEAYWERVRSIFNHDHEHHFNDRLPDRF